MIPRLAARDSTASFLLDGYTFGRRRFERLRTNAFRTRLMLKPVTIMRGADAARLFYEGNRFTRSSALPSSTLLLLQDEGSVQSLDGAPHDHRKLMFLAVTQEEETRRLVSIFRDDWERAAAEWGTLEEVELHAALLPLLTRTAMSWAGVPVEGGAVLERTDEFAAMLENAGRFGPPTWAARTRRNHSEEWARDLIRRTRSGQLSPSAGSALRIITDHLEADGKPLSTKIAAVELINVLRPIVAVGRYIVFSALALHRHPRWARSFASGNDSDLENFVNEVRRFYPFFPVVGGRATTSFEWNGHKFGIGDWVLLDLYGTNHDGGIWSDPDRFRPERFRDWNGDRGTLIPQGGGDVAHGHRCPGESITVELMKEAVRQLARHLVYSVPDQDLRVSLRRFPAIPESRFVMKVAARRLRADA
ncbi:MAG: cytochrome [Microbacteriaceae bacterium]|jgi:fatty-acid peroxygenase|nr:cytochrome [Microbacteriaceae bacterium]HEV7957269.1 cytochrome P450 [Marisediminicola sp.]